MSYIRGYDPETLREKVDPRQCKERLDEIGEQRSLPALLERVWLLKVLGRPDDALVLSEQSVRVARMAGTRKDLMRARILHASVQQVRGAFAAAEQELTMCADEAEGQGWAGIAAFAYQHRGGCTSTPESSTPRVATSSGRCSCARSRVRPTTSSSRRCSRSMPSIDAGPRHPSPADDVVGTF